MAMKAAISSAASIVVPYSSKGSKSSRALLKWQATHDGLAVVGIRKADANGLVNEEHVRMLIPGIRIRLRRVRARRATWTWFASR